MHSIIIVRIISAARTWMRLFANVVVIIEGNSLEAAHAAV